MVCFNHATIKDAIPEIRVIRVHFAAYIYRQITILNQVCSAALPANVNIHHHIHDKAISYQTNNGGDDDNDVDIIVTHFCISVMLTDGWTFYLWRDSCECTPMRNDEIKRKDIANEKYFNTHISLRFLIELGKLTKRDF